MKGFFNQDLVNQFGYGMAVYISAKMAAMQRGIDATNTNRIADGRHLLDNVSVEEVIGVLRRKGQLPA